MPNTTGTISGDLAKAARSEWPPCNVKPGASGGMYPGARPDDPDSAQVEYEAALEIAMLGQWPPEHSSKGF